MDGLAVAYYRIFRLAVSFAQLGPGSAERVLVERQARLDAGHELRAQRRFSESERAAHELGQDEGVVRVGPGVRISTELEEESPRLLQLPLRSEKLRGDGEAVSDLLRLARVTDAGDEFKCCRHLRSALAAKTKQAKLDQASLGHDRVADPLGAFEQRPGERKRLVDPAEHSEEIGRLGRHRLRELDNPVLGAEGNALAGLIECRLRPLVLPDGYRKVVVDCGGAASLALLDRAPECFTHVREPSTLTEIRTGTAQDAERSHRLGEVELLGEGTRLLGGRDRLVVGRTDHEP